MTVTAAQNPAEAGAPVPAVVRQSTPRYVLLGTEAEETHSADATSESPADG